MKRERHNIRVDSWNFLSQEMHGGVFRLGLGAVAETKEWFKGVTLGSLDGTIITESIETGATTMALRLSVGDDIRVDCECPSFTSADIAPFFGKRVRVSGRIFYKGDTGLPYKVELLEIPRLVKSDPDFLRWKGAFWPFDEAQGWDS